MSNFTAKTIEANIERLRRFSITNPSTYKNYILEQDSSPFTELANELFSFYVNPQRNMLARLGINMQLPVVDSDRINKISAVLAGLDLRYETEIEEQKRLEQLVGEKTYWSSPLPSDDEMRNYNRYNTLKFLSGDEGNFLDVKKDLPDIQKTSEYDIAYLDPLFLLSTSSSLAFASMAIHSSSPYFLLASILCGYGSYKSLQTIANNHKSHPKFERYDQKLRRMDLFLKKHYPNEIEA